MKNILDRDSPLIQKLVLLASIGGGAGWWTMQDANGPQYSMTYKIGFSIACAAIIAVIGGVFILRDRTTHRITQGQEVGRIEKLLFTPGCVAVAFWLVVGTIALMALLLLMALNQP